MKRIITILGICCALPLFIILVVFVLGIFSAREQSKEARISPETQQAGRVLVGSQAPEVFFLTFDGKEKRLSEFRGKPVMFWLIATWCLTCKAGAQVLADRISDKDLWKFRISRSFY